MIVWASHHHDIYHPTAECNSLILSTIYSCYVYINVTESFTDNEIYMNTTSFYFSFSSWTPTHWLDRNSSFKRVIQLTILIFFWQVAELNCFWLKHVFIVKPSHFLTQGRIAIITLSSAPAIR